MNVKEKWNQALMHSMKKKKEKRKKYYSLNYSVVETKLTYKFYIFFRQVSFLKILLAAE